jgi:hypothetical protein
MSKKVGGRVAIKKLEGGHKKYEPQSRDLYDSVGYSLSYPILRV